jgi:MSHA biogenesis protein MshK
MAEHLNLRPWRKYLCAAIWIGAAGSGQFAAAQGLGDPTQPPLAPQRTASGFAAPDSGPALQSILISQFRIEAIISGKVVHAGDRVGNAHVVNISESEVVLRNENGLQTLKLFPGLVKRPVPTAAVTTPSRNAPAKKNK